MATIKIERDDTSDNLVTLNITTVLPTSGLTYGVTAMWKKPVGHRKEAYVRVHWGSIGGSDPADAKACGEAIIAASAAIETLIAETETQA